MKKLKLEEVFTPKGQKINSEMYMKRPTLEDALLRALRKQKNIIVHGQSGSGKTWLYKRVFAVNSIYYEVLNSATISSSDSVSSALNNLCSRIDPVEQTEYSEGKSAKIDGLVAAANVTHEKKYKLNSDEAFLRLIKVMSKRGGEKKKFLVVENLEHIVKSEKLIKELTSLILYLDDEDYAQYGVHLLLVGTPSNIQEYFAKAAEGQTIANRVVEIPEVSAFDYSVVEKLVRKGFFKLLSYKLDSMQDDGEGEFTMDNFIARVSSFSANMPQYVQEICLCIGFFSEENRKMISANTCLKGLGDWASDALVSDAVRIENHKNSKETKHGRRNQVMYTAATIHKDEFTSAEIESKLRELFPLSTKGRTLAVAFNLKVLTNGEHPILRKSPTANTYRFFSPKVEIMIRWMIQKENDSENLTVKPFDESTAVYAKADY